MDPQQPGPAKLPPQGGRFCLLIYSASKKEEAQLNGHTRTNTELKPQHKENKNSRDQRGQGAAQEREPE